MDRCLTAKIKNGKLFVRIKDTKGCSKIKKSAQEIVDSIKTNKIIFKKDNPQHRRF